MRGRGWFKYIVSSQNLARFKIETLLFPIQQILLAPLNWHNHVWTCVLRILHCLHEQRWQTTIPEWASTPTGRGSRLLEFLNESHLNCSISNINWTLAGTLLFLHQKTLNVKRKTAKNTKIVLNIDVFFNSLTFNDISKIQIPGLTDIPKNWVV